MRSTRSRLVAALALMGALAVTSALTACGGSGGDTGGDVGVATNKVTNTSLPTLFTVRRGGTMIAAVFHSGGTPAQGQLIFSQGMVPTPGDSWDEVGNAPPPGWCETYGQQLADPITATWSQPDPVNPGEDWKMYVGNMSNQQPCPEMPPK